MSEDNRFDQRFEDENETVKNMSPVAKVIGVFVAPTAAFRAIREKHEVIIPLVLVPLVMVLYYVLMWDSIAQVVIRQTEEQYLKMGMDVMPGVIEQSLYWQRIFTPIGIVVGFFAGLAFTALFYWIAGLIAKAEFSYGQAFVMSSYLSLLTIVTYAIMVIMTLITGEYDTMRPVTSLVSLMPESAVGTMPYFLAVPVEVISIWSMFLSYIALVAMGRFSKKAAAMTIVVEIAGIMLITVGGGLLTTLISNLVGM